MENTKLEAVAADKNEETERTVNVEIQLELTEEEYLAARELSSAQLCEMVVEQWLRGRRPDSLNTWVFGPIEMEESLENDTSYECQNCGARLYVLADEILSRSPTIYKRVCGECRSDRIVERV